MLHQISRVSGEQFIINWGVTPLRKIWSVWWLLQGVPCLHPQTAGVDSSSHVTMSAGEAVMENGWKDEKEFLDVNRNGLKIIHTFWQSGHFGWNKGCGKIPDHHSTSWLSLPEGIKSSLIYVCVMNKKYWLGAMSISLFLNIESIRSISNPWDEI